MFFEIAWNILIIILLGIGDMKNVCWLKDGQLLEPGNHLKISQLENGFTLTIHPCSPNDAGVYTCKIENDVEKITSSATLTVLDTNLAEMSQERKSVFSGADEVDMQPLGIKTIFKPKIQTATQAAVVEEQTLKPVDKKILKAIDTPNIQAIELAVILPHSISSSAEPCDGLAAPTLQAHSLMADSTPFEDTTTFDHLDDNQDSLEKKQEPKILAYPDKVMYQEGDSMYLGCVVEGINIC